MPQQRQAQHNRGKHNARFQPDLILHAGRARSNSNPFYKTKTKKKNRKKWTSNPGSASHSRRRPWLPAKTQKN